MMTTLDAMSDAELAVRRDTLAADARFDQDAREELEATEREIARRATEEGGAMRSVGDLERARARRIQDEEREQLEGQPAREREVRDATNRLAALTAPWEAKLADLVAITAELRRAISDYDRARTSAFGRGSVAAVFEARAFERAAGEIASALKRPLLAPAPPPWTPVTDWPI
jgi:hypothetical protein